MPITQTPRRAEHLQAAFTAAQRIIDELDETADHDLAHEAHELADAIADRLSGADQIRPEASA